MKKILLPIFLSLIIAMPVLTKADFGFGSTLDSVAGQSGYSTSNDTSIDEKISSFISIFLSFLGVIFLVLMLYGGYTWMTAAGDEKKIDKAKDTIRAAVIGVIIVVAAYALSVFVISKIWGSTSSQSLLRPAIAYAQTTGTITPQNSPMLDRLKNVGTGAGYSDSSETTVLDIVSTAINVGLSLLGTIFVILILLAGYNWMTASGDEEKLTRAKSTIKAAIIGLIIVAGAFAIWNFIATYFIGDGGATL